MKTKKYEEIKNFKEGLKIKDEQIRIKDEELKFIKEEMKLVKNENQILKEENKILKKDTPKKVYFNIQTLYSSFNSIQLNQQLSSGGFGSVWLGKENIAIKKIPKDKMNYKSFEKEVLIQSNFIHENIVKCYGWTEDQNNYYILMELMDYDLSELIYEKKEKLNENQKKDILLQILKALDYIHSQNIVHRDIKPNNCLIKKVNDKFIVKLTDFGISQEKNNLTTPSFTLNALGTIYYMSPELLSESIYSLKTDIYAVGILMYEVFYERVPFDENMKNLSQYKFTQEILKGTRPLLKNPSSPSEIEKIMIKCWDKELDNRPSCLDLLKMVENLKK